MKLPRAHIVPVRLSNNRLGYRLEQHFTSAPQHFHIGVPAGFEYDGGSAPRWSWSLFGMLPDGLHREATLVHDYLYRYNTNHIYTRLLVDCIFRAMLRDYGVATLKAKIAYVAVRLCGRRRWKKYKKQKV